MVHEALDKAGVGLHSSLDVRHQLNTVLADVLVSLQENSSKLQGECHISQAAAALDTTGSAAPGSQAFNPWLFTQVKVLKGQAVGHGLEEEPVFCPALWRFCCARPDSTCPQLTLGWGWLLRGPS